MKVDEIWDLGIDCDGSSTCSGTKDRKLHDCFIQYNRKKCPFLIHKMIKVASEIPPRFYFLKQTHRHSVKYCTIYPKNITQYSFKKLSKFLMFGIHTGH